MNINKLSIEEFEKEIDKLLKNKTPEQLLKELKDCGLEVKEDVNTDS